MVPLTQAIPPVILVRIVGGVWVICADHVPRTIEARYGRGVARRGGKIGRIYVFPHVRKREVGRGIARKEPPLVVAV